MSVSRRPWALVGLILALLASLPAALRADSAAPDVELAELETPGAPLARLLAPAAGDRLVPGTLVEVAWEPGPALAALSHVEEWEAFLSLDGGATYPLRITPHLDADRRSFLWRVPDLPAASARLLLRFGDERREVGMEAPGSFEIAGHGSAAVWEAPPARVFRRGERARPTGAGVVSWVEGPRDGSRSREVEAGAPPGGLRSAQPGRGLALLLAGAAPQRVAPAPPPSLAVDAAAPAPPLAAAGPAAPLATVPVRLLIHRFNE